ncbi:MAG: MoxR family ATPase [Treponema sp.]|jgi:MoxR-like ATPase|nr:MoxR family ATPase [Treponema sp.]
MDQYSNVQGILEAARRELAKRIIGQEDMINGLLMALIAGGHVLLEGVPGLAKTRAVKALAELTGLGFKRIQFTPDLLPADLTGTLIWDQGRSVFSVRKGPLFANLVLADEINRAPAKVQSALLEAMEEYQVTIGEETYPLPNPFFVLATQNPIDHEGTYSLPEAELDRFLLKLLITYPNPEEEVAILNLDPQGGRGGKHEDSMNFHLDYSMIEALRRQAHAVRCDEQIQKYIVQVVTATRPNEDSRKSHDDLYRYISFGASPRASLALYRCSKIIALFEGRSFVTPEDIKAAALPVLRHRIVLSYEAEADGLDSDDVISRILAFIPVP